MFKKVCLVNAHWSNRGDEAAIRPIINEVLSFPNIRLTVIFKDRRPVQYFPYENKVDAYSLQYLPMDLKEIETSFEMLEKDSPLSKMISILKEQDLLIYSPGGAVISDKFWWRKQLEYFLPFICSEKFKIPIVVAAPSIGPFDQDQIKNSLRYRWLSIAKEIYVREHISKKYLENIGVERVQTTIDTAFYDEPDAALEQEILFNDAMLHDFFKNNKKVVGITLTDFSWNVEYKSNYVLLKNLNKTMHNFVHFLLKNSYSVLLIPQLFGNQNDYSYLKQFVLGNGIRVMSDKYDTYFQQYIISKCYAIVGMRYHSNIFAAKMGIPFLSIGYEEKMYGFMEQWELNDYLIKINELNDDVIIKKWTDLESSYSELKIALTDKRACWKKIASQTLNMIKGYL